MSGTVQLPLMISTLQWDKLIALSEEADTDWDALVAMMIEEAKILHVNSSPPGLSLAINVRIK